jgi:hypothetical protein
MSSDKDGGLSDEAVLDLLKRVANAKTRMFEMPVVVLDAMLPRQLVLIIFYAVEERTVTN